MKQGVFAAQPGHPARPGQGVGGGGGGRGRRPPSPRQAASPQPARPAWAEGAFRVAEFPRLERLCKLQILLGKKFTDKGTPQRALIPPVGFFQIVIFSEKWMQEEKEESVEDILEEPEVLANEVEQVVVGMLNAIVDDGEAELPPAPRGPRVFEPP